MRQMSSPNDTQMAKLNVHGIQREKGDVIQPRLSNEETKARKILKWNSGFFMTEDPNAPRPPPRQSPSVQETAAAATATNQALHN